MTSVTVLLDIGTATVKWARSSDCSVRAVIPTPRRLSAALRSSQPRAAVQDALLPVLQLVYHQEGLAARRTRGAPNQVGLLVDDTTNPDVEGVVREFFEQSAQCSVARVASPPAALAAAGLAHGIVIDVGFHSTRCHAVMHGFTLPRTCNATPRGYRTALDALRDELLSNAAVRDRHGKRLLSDAAEGVLETLLLGSPYVAPPPPAHAKRAAEAFALSTSDRDAFDADAAATERSAVSTGVPVLLRADVVPVHPARAMEVFFAGSENAEGEDGGDTAPDPVGEVVRRLAKGPSIAETALQTMLHAIEHSPVGEGARACSAIAIVGSCSDVPNFRRRLLDEVLFEASVSTHRAAPTVLKALSRAVMADVAPFNGTTAATIGAVVASRPPAQDDDAAAEKGGTPEQPGSPHGGSASGAPTRSSVAASLSATVVPDS